MHPNEIPDHPAIYPTGVMPDPKNPSLSKLHFKIYNHICKRFIASHAS